MVRVILEGKMGGGVFSLYPPLLYPSNLRENEGERGGLNYHSNPTFCTLPFFKKIIRVTFLTSIFYTPILVFLITK